MEWPPWKERLQRIGFGFIESIPHLRSIEDVTLPSTLCRHHPTLPDEIFMELLTLEAGISSLEFRARNGPGDELNINDR
jgi:hypothetical protein